MTALSPPNVDVVPEGSTWYVWCKTCGASGPPTDWATALVDRREHIAVCRKRGEPR